MNHQGSHGFASGLFLGATLGAISALLLAPRSGREIRAGLYAGGKRLKERAVDQASDVIGRGEAAVETAREAAREAADGVKRGAARILGKSEDRREDRIPSSLSP
jgi:gas vesicle protein